MEEKIDTPWWRTPLQVLGVVLGLAALAGTSMALIFFVARVLDNVSLPAMETAVPPAPPPPEQNARNRVPSPYGLVPWPDSPGRMPSVSVKIGDSMRPSGGGGSSGAGRSAPAPQVPVGISSEEYRDAVASGRKLYLPNPQGECDLSGASTTQSAQSLEDCLARQAAR